MSTASLRGDARTGLFFGLIVQYFGLLGFFTIFSRFFRAVFTTFAMP